MLTIANKGQEIVSTNYWDGELADRGEMVVSWNAGAARLLVPRVHENALPDMLAARHVIITFGKYREHHDLDAFEILFEDGSDEPYVVFMAAEQSDRRLPKSDAGIQFPFTIWTKGGLKGRLPGHYRLARIPCLKPL